MWDLCIYLYFTIVTSIHPVGDVTLETKFIIVVYLLHCHTYLLFPPLCNCVIKTN